MASEARESERGMSQPRYIAEDDEPPEAVDLDLEIASKAETDGSFAIAYALLRVAAAIEKRKGRASHEADS